MKNHTIRLATLTLVGGLALAGCDRQTTPQGEATPKPGDATQTVTLPDNLFAAAPLADARDLVEVKKSAKVGDTVTFAGAVGGRKAPFADDRAVFLVADHALKRCSEGCVTPWDLCCETAETIAAHSASVQVVDADGRPLKIGLDGQNGLAPGANVQISGKVKQNQDGVCVVNASAIHVLSN